MQYEEKLMKMNEDLALAQTEIKNLRQRLTSNLNTSSQVFKPFTNHIVTV
jgi:hypothetical protein